MDRPSKSSMTKIDAEAEFIPLLGLLEEQTNELTALRTSTSWRLTAPLRRLLDRLRGRSGDAL